MALIFVDTDFLIFDSGFISASLIFYSMKNEVFLGGQVFLGEKDGKFLAVDDTLIDFDRRKDANSNLILVTPS